MPEATDDKNHARIVIVGAGVTGLAAGFHLRRHHGIEDVLVLEAQDEVGGNITTTSDDGFLIENGPNGFLDSVPETLELARDLNLEPLPSNDASRKRFLIVRERLVQVPEGALSFLTSPLLSFRGRLRVFCEPIARRRPGDDETVFDFAARRIGKEAAEVLVDTMVTGVFAGDSTRLSLQSAFPKMAAMEARHGSLTRAMLARLWKRITGHGDASPGGPSGPAGVLTSFSGGLSTLVGALREELGGAVRCGVAVQTITHQPATKEAFRLETSAGTYSAEKVLLAVPAPQCAAILESAQPEAATILRQIPSSPITVVACSFDRASFPHSLDGFGFLVPNREQSRLLGCLWTSSIFPDRAPADKVLLRSMVGGARDPEAMDLPEDELRATVLRELRRFLGPIPDPERVWIFPYPQGISQYPPGHDDRVEALERQLADWPGMHVAGNSFRGISVNCCIVQAKEAAARLA